MGPKNFATRRSSKTRKINLEKINFCEKITQNDTKKAQKKAQNRKMFAYPLFAYIHQYAFERC